MFTILELVKLFFVHTKLIAKQRWSINSTGHLLQLQFSAGDDQYCHHVPDNDKVRKYKRLGHE